jgi:hypothetical protein
MQKFILLNIYTRSSRKVTVWNRRSEKLVEYETNQIKQHRHQTKRTTQLAGNMGCEPNGVEKATKKLGQARPFTTRGCAAPGRWYMAWSFWFFCLEHLLHRRCSSSRVRLPIAGAPYIFPCAEGASGWALSVAAQFGTRWFPSPVRILSLS